MYKWNNDVRSACTKREINGKNIKKKQKWRNVDLNSCFLFFSFSLYTVSVETRAGAYNIKICINSFFYFFVSFYYIALKICKNFELTLKIRRERVVSRYTIDDQFTGFFVLTCHCDCCCCCYDSYPSSSSSSSASSSSYSYLYNWNNKYHFYCRCFFCFFFTS